MKIHFYISNEDDARLCEESVQLSKPIAIGGTDSLTGRGRSYKGTVLSIEPAPMPSLGERWRIVMDAQ